MGDTGSMVIGFLLAYQAINFMSVDFNPNFMIQNTKAPIFILALFSFPFIDTARVFLLRLMKKKSPFTADKNHIHHVFLEYGLKHWQIATLASFYTITMVLIIFIFNDLSINKQIVLLLGLWAATVVVVNNLNLISQLKDKSSAKNLNKNSIEEPKKQKGKTIILRDLA